MCKQPYTSNRWGVGWGREEGRGPSIGAINANQILPTLCLEQVFTRQQLQQQIQVQSANVPTWGGCIC